MRFIVLIISLYICSAGAMAQDTPDKMKPVESTKYCAKLKDGKIMVIMQDKKEVIADVNLTNGTTIKPDGTILKADGAQIDLKNGECVDSKGELINEKNADKKPR